MEGWEKKLEYAFGVVLLSFMLYIVCRLPSCGSQNKMANELPPRVEPTNCGDLKLGQIKSSTCPDGGAKIEACTEKGLVVAIDCKAPSSSCGKTTFVEVKPLIEKKCLSCHPGFNVFANASKAGPEMVRRVNLDPASAQRMPKTPAAPLAGDEKDLFRKWQADSFLEKCDTTQIPSFQHVDLDGVESVIVDDLNKLNDEDRKNARYLVATHKVDLNVPPADLATYIAGANKGLNSIAKKARKLTQLTPVGASGSILRFNLQDLELSTADWDKIIAADPLKIESFTNTGLQIKALAKNARPWMHFDNFVDTVFRNSSLYYNLLGVPQTFDLLTKQLDVKFAADLLNFKAQLIGTNQSPISLHKNRLISRHDSLDGHFWVTYDTAGLNGVKQRNLFEFPLLKETGGKAIYDFQASEVIYTLPNGLQGYALFNAVGARQDAAPLNVVTDIDSPISPEIRAGNSCHRCHAGGLIPAVDEIRDHVIQNASQFNVIDVDLVKVLYRTADINSQVFTKDNSDFVKSLAATGVKAGADPISFATDHLLLNWNISQVASFFFIKKEEFVQLLNESATARAQVGQLLSGGSITYDQFVTVLPVLVKDLRLFQQPIGG